MKKRKNKFSLFEDKEFKELAKTFGILFGMLGTIKLIHSLNK